MFTTDPEAFFAHAAGVPADLPATARAVFLVIPDAFAFAGESASDNPYMSTADVADRDLALAQHADLRRALSATLPVIAFSGVPGQPDGTFPNNVFATTAGRSIVGRMRYPGRQAEATRADIRTFLSDLLGKREVDLSTQPHPCELTGALVIDRARGLGYVGLSERCDLAGARLMHEAFGLRATLAVDLAPGEYHTNVVFTVLAGRACLIAPDGFADPDAARAIAAFYGAGGIELSARERTEFVGNAISVTPDAVWMSARADAALTPENRAALAAAGFAVRSVDLSALEASAGGSLRCCVAEIF